MEICRRLYTWLPCPCTTKKHNNKEESYPLKNRILQHWRMVPAMLPIVVCIAGIMTAIVFKNYYSIIPFGMAIPANFPALYIIYEWKNMKSFSEENAKYEEQNHLFQEKIDTFDQELYALRAENQIYKEQNEQFKNERERFEKTVTVLEGENQKLERLNQEYEAHLELHRKLAQEQSEKLAAISETLIKVQEKASQNHKEFGDSLGDLKSQIIQFSSENQKLQETSESLDRESLKKTQQIEEVLKSALIILESMEAWKNAEVTAQLRIEKLQLVEKMLSKTEKKLNRIEKKLSEKQVKEGVLIERLETLHTELGEQEKFLKSLRSSLNTTAQDLTSAADDMKRQSQNHLSNLADQVEQTKQKLTGTVEKITSAVAETT